MLREDEKLKEKEKRERRKGRIKEGGKNNNFSQTFSVHVDGETFLKAAVRAPVPSCFVNHALTLSSYGKEIKRYMKNLIRTRRVNEVKISLLQIRIYAKCRENREKMKET